MIYMSGAILRMMSKLKLVKDCQNCRHNLLIRHGTADEHDDDFIEAREFQRGKLIRPGNYGHFLINNSLNYLFYMILRVCESKSIAVILRTSLKKQLNFNSINCSEHNLGEQLCNLLVRCSLFWWCKSVNSILKGTDTKFKKFLSLKPHSHFIDPVKMHALKMYNKKRKYLRNK